MNFLRLIPIMPVFLVIACAPNLYAEENDLYPEGHYKYTNIRTQIDHIYIINNNDLKVATLADLDLSATIVDNASTASPIVLAFDRPYHIVFYIPKDFDAEMKQWGYATCRYEVLGYGHGFRPGAKKDVYDYLIEQRCEGDSKVVRYEYADYYGLQSFGVGEYKDNPNGELVFEIQDVYALYGAEIGFGARTKH